MVSNRQRAYLRRLDDRGAVAPLVALSLFALVGIAGVAFDYSRVAGLDSELQNGADQAALAGASQLDKESGACARAANAAIGLLSNPTLLANDNDGVTVKINDGTTIAVDDDACTSVAGITFYEDKDKATVATADADAAFIEVAVDARQANFAFTPVVGLFSSGDMVAKALAGLGSSVCKVPPMMICSPDPTTTIDWSTMQGFGIEATGQNANNSSGKGGAAGSSTAGNTWSPGNFGFLEVNDPDASNTNAALLKALAYTTPPIDCTPIGDNNVSTGNPQGMYDAINTRFDLYDFNDNGTGNVLASCQGGACPPSTNVVKDFQNDNTDNTGANSCKVGTNGWHMPTNEFYPIGTPNGQSYQDSNHDGTAGDLSVTITNPGGHNPQTYTMQMGLPRDLCHYMTFNGTGLCSGGGGTGRFGDGVWDRFDYFTTNHGSDSTNWPSDWSTITRYNTYLWELGDYGSGGSLPTVTGQKSSPMCFKGNSALEDPSRRVMTVAIVTNCADLNGTSKPANIQDWIDVFLVEPSTDDAQRHNAFKDAIYLEVIGPSRLAGDGSYASQEVRRDVPYLVQ
jgi:Flp pilus assembly protein TadG